MSENAYYPVTNGQEIQLGDMKTLGITSGLADDHTLAEILRMAPYTANVYKTIVPYYVRAAGQAGSLIQSGNSPTGTVSPSGNADGSVRVWPFRAVAGSRNLVNAASPAGPSGVSLGQADSDALSNWRDIRSGVFVGGATQLFQSIALAANASGNPRWDLVYATITPDSNGPSINRRIKSTTTGAITIAAVPSWLTAPVVVTVLAGTPGAVPALPTLPADTAGSVNLTLGYVRVPNGFGSGSTIATQDIRAFTSLFTQFTDLHLPKATSQPPGTPAWRSPVTVSPF